MLFILIYLVLNNIFSSPRISKRRTTFKVYKLVFSTSMIKKINSKSVLWIYVSFYATYSSIKLGITKLYKTHIEQDIYLNNSLINYAIKILVKLSTRVVFQYRWSNHTSLYRRASTVEIVLSLSKLSTIDKMTIIPQIQTLNGLWSLRYETHSINSKFCFCYDSRDKRKVLWQTIVNIDKQQITNKSSYITDYYSNILWIRVGLPSVWICWIFFVRIFRHNKNFVEPAVVHKCCSIRKI